MKGKEINRAGCTAFIQPALKTAGLIAGIIAAIPFFFSWIALLIGAVYYFRGKGLWRQAGFILALAAALGANAPLRGFDEITGIYPLFLVVYVVTGTFALYFLALAANKLLSSRRSYRKFKEQLQERFAAVLTLSGTPRKAAALALFLIPAALWASVNLDFAVIFDNKPRLLWVHAPSTVAPGEAFTFQVQCWDRFERISALYRGTVRFSLESYDFDTGEPLAQAEALLPPAYTFSGASRPSDMAYMLANGKDNGRRIFEGRIDTPGIHYLKVADSETERTYYSNPILVWDNPTRIYWGDIHTHGIFSDGSGTPAHQFFYARHVAALDFYALTEHGEIIQLGKNRVSRYIEETNRANRPGQFVTFPGIEYTNHKTGHYTCIFDGERLPVDPLIYAPYFGLKGGLQTPNDLWKVLDDFTEATGDAALALPHHTVVERFMQDWTYYHPRYVKLAEVASTHGDNLYEPDHPLSYRGSTFPPPPGTRGCSITSALQMGLQLSLYASSDSHDGHPGRDLSRTRAFIGHQRPFTYWWTRFDKPYPGGLTAAYAEELSRRGIFSALENRQIYAVSDHGRPLLFFTINGIPVGGDSTIKVNSREAPREIRVIVAQDGAPAAATDHFASGGAGPQPDWKAVIEIHKNGELLASIPVNKPFAAVSYMDTEPVAGAAYGPENCVFKDGAYYINHYSDNPVDPAALNTGGKDFYLVRVVGANGRHAYIGPLWVEAGQATNW